MHRLVLVALLSLAACGAGEPSGPTPEVSAAPGVRAVEGAALQDVAPAPTTAQVSVTVRNSTSGPRFCHVNVLSQDAQLEHHMGTVLYEVVRAGETRTLTNVASGRSPLYLDLKAGCSPEGVDTEDRFFRAVRTTLTDSRAFTFNYNEVDPDAPMVLEE